MDQSKSLAPPQAAVRPVRSLLHGENRVDEYAWLRERGDPEVTSYLEAENAYAESILASTNLLQESLYQEMLGRIKQTDLSVPYPDRGWLYYSRTTEGSQYRVYCRRERDVPGAPEVVVLDLNRLAEQTSYMAIGAFAVNDSGQWLAYSTDETGYRQYRLQVKDLETGEVLPGVVERAGSVAWSQDGQTLFYSVEDESKRHYRIFRVSVSAQGLGESTMVYEEEDQAFSVQVHRSRCGRWLILTTASHTTSEVLLLPADRPMGQWQVVVGRIPEIEYDVAPHGQTLYIRINDTGRNFRLVRTLIDQLGRDGWEEVRPHDANVMLEGVDAFESHLVLWEREAGLPEIRILPLTGEAIRRLSLPDAAYDVSPAPNREWKTHLFRFHYESLLTPPSVFEEDVFQRDRTLLKQTEVLGDFDPTRYRTERLSVTASDGTSIPVSLIVPAESDAGPIPLLVEGYGAYGIPYPLSFSSTRLSLLDRGLGLASAHVRGGGELGKAWHDAGRMAQKDHTFDDFLAVLDSLVSQHRTTKDQLFIEGGSAGGLLIGAVLNRDPTCCRGALLQVPFVDVINTMLDASLPLTVGEYEEWGNPHEAESYRWMRSYCPYTNVREAAYPAMLVRTSYHDSQVMYWEPAKYVARMRARRTGDAPLLLVTNMGAGHGGASGRYDRLREIALDYAFILWVLGASSSLASGTCSDTSAMTVS